MDGSVHRGKGRLLTMSTQFPDAQAEAALLASVLARLTPSGGSAPAFKARRHSVAWTMPGFLAGTRITTTFGALPIEALRVPDPIRTTAGPARRLRWIGKIRLDSDFLFRHPEAQPIRIKANALGPERPERDLLVSPGQVFELVATDLPRHHMAAGSIRGHKDVFRAPQTALTYYVLEFDAPATVYVEGVPAFIPLRPQEPED
jgi:hypothetical protein